MPAGRCSRLSAPARVRLLSLKGAIFTSTPYNDVSTRSFDTASLPDFHLNHRSTLLRLQPPPPPQFGILTCTPHPGHLVALLGSTFPLYQTIKQRLDLVSQLYCSPYRLLQQQQQASLMLKTPRGSLCPATFAPLAKLERGDKH
jgi:hypothetical protein